MARGLFQIVLELPRARRVAQLAPRLRLNLADAFAGDVDLLANSSQGAGTAVLQPEAELQDAPLATGQRVQNRLHLLLQELMGSGFRRGKGAPVLDEVAEMRVLFLADSRLEGDRLLGDFDDLADLLRSDDLLLALGHRFGDLFDRRLAAQLLEQGSRDADQAVDDRKSTRLNSSHA